MSSASIPLGNFRVHLKFNLGQKEKLVIVDYSYVAYVKYKTFFHEV